MENDSTDTVERQYDLLARVYDRMWRRYLQQTIPRVVDRICETRPERVLDVGCGTGELERMLLNRYTPAQIVGVDVSEEMLEVARRKVAVPQEVTFLRADAISLPLDSQQFDCVVSVSSLHYMADPRAALREMRRTLMPDGRLIILDWCRDYMSCRIYDRVLSLFDPAYQKCYTLDELKDLLEAGGFQTVDTMRYSFGVIWGIMLIESHPADSPVSEFAGR